MSASSKVRVGDDVPARDRWAWLTPRRTVEFVLIWLGLFSLGSVLVANPFQSETSAGATPQYWHVMYLHGMLIGLAGLAALLACLVFELQSSHTRLWILAGVVVATVAAALGGIFDKNVPGSEVAMWTQVIGFFALDEILLVLAWGLFRERPHTRDGRALAFWTAWVAAVSMFVAALIGHLAGWILEFGAHPGVILRYVEWIGVQPGDFLNNLIGSHSHDMAVAIMALITVLAVQQFGLSKLTGTARAVALAAVGWIGLGVVLMTITYMVMAFTSWAPPTLFQSAGGTNGVAGDDIVTGLTVMLGGLVALSATVVGRWRDLRSARQVQLPLASVVAWLASFAVVVVAGYSIELNETYFGAGGQAPGATNDAVFTWLHQDIGLFLMPGLVLVAVAAYRLVSIAHQILVGWLILAGTAVTFLGAMFYVFVEPALHGIGYAISTIGLATTAAALLLAIYRIITDRSQPPAEPTVTPAPPTAALITH